MGMPDVTVVVPAYNEEAVITVTLEAVAAHFARQQTPYEVLVVDDGSVDRTTHLVREVARPNPCIRLLESPHRGKGAAIKRGVLEATGRYLVFMDADHATRIEEWDKCVPWLYKGFPVVIGSRKMPGADVQQHQPPLREAMGKVFTWLTNVLLATNVSDITCGFKCFHTEAARKIFSLQRIEGWGFDAEILFITRRLGYRIKEVPVTWRDDPRTKVRLLRDTIRSFSELLSIRRGAWRGWYPTPPKAGVVS